MNLFSNFHCLATWSVPVNTLIIHTQNIGYQWPPQNSFQEGDKFTQKRSVSPIVGSGMETYSSSETPFLSYQDMLHVLRERDSTSCCRSLAHECVLIDHLRYE